MLNAVKIENFQSLKDVKFELGNITIIHGPSGTGKSAITRALRSLITNNLTGLGTVTYGQTLSKVTAVFDSNQVVQIQKGSANKYILKNQQGTQVFDRIGRSVPEPVVKAMNMPSISFDTDLDINFNIQTQHEPPFLLTRAGDAAKVIGRLSRLNVIFIAMREANKDQKRANADLATKDSLISTTRLELDTFANVDDEAQALAKAREKSNEIQQTESRFNRLTELLAAYTATKEQLATLSASTVIPTEELALRAAVIAEAESKTQRLTTLCELFTTYTSQGSKASEDIGAIDTVLHAFAQNERVIALENIRNTFNTTSSSMVLWTNEIAAIDEAVRNSVEFMPVVCRLIDMSSVFNRYANECIFISRTNQELETITADLSNKKDEYHRILDELGICPTCGQSTKGAHL